MLRVAAVGAGYFSQFHYDSWARIPDVKLVGSCDQDLSKAQQTGLPAFDDLATMLSEIELDALDIILPPTAHRHAIETALAAGIQTIICQKPFCLDLQEATEVAHLAEEAGVTLIVHENFRFMPWYRALKTALEDGSVGALVQITYRLRPGDGQGPEAYLDRQPYFQTMKRFMVHETGVHWVDTFRFLLGDPTAIYADLRQVNPVIAGEDAGFVLFDFEGGVRAVLDGNRNLDHAAANLRCTMGEALVEGTDGTITLRGDGSLWHREFHELEEVCIFKAPQTDTFGGDCVHGLQSHVVSGLLHGTQIENTAREYLSVIEVEEAIYLSDELGQKLKVKAR